MRYKKRKLYKRYKIRRRITATQASSTVPHEIAALVKEVQEKEKDEAAFGNRNAAPPYSRV